MVRTGRGIIAALTAVAGVLSASTASAGPLADWFGPAAAPGTSYSPFRFWAPGAARVVDDLHGPKLDVYAPDRHPEIPPTYVVLQFPRPAVDPAATIIEPPAPPATSRFKY
jgi:hypothetical protein